MRLRPASPACLGLAPAAALAAALTLAAAAAAASPPRCDSAGTPRVLLSGQGTLESVVSDRSGRLVFGDLERNAVLRLAHPGAKPRTIFKGGSAGLARVNGRAPRLTVGIGKPLLPGAAGIVVGEVGPALFGALTAAGIAGPAKLAIFDERTGRAKVVAGGLSMVNGVAPGPQRTFFVTNHEALYVQRVASGNVAPRWAIAFSANGAVVDRAGRYLYVAQTFAPAAIQRIDLADPRRVDTFATAPPLSAAAGLDGLRLGPDGRLYAVAHASGELWRIGRDGAICTLASGMGRGLLGPSDVAFGSGRHGFRARSAFVTSFAGEVFEVPRALPRAVRP